MVLFINCLICGCGFNNGVIITDTCLLKKYWDIMWGDFPEIVIDNAVGDGEMTEKDGDLLSKSFKYDIKQFNWLKDIIALTSTKIVKVTGTGEEEFTDSDGNVYDVMPHNWGTALYKEKSYFMHHDCYKFLKKNNYDMSYDSFVRIDDIKTGTKHIRSQNIYFNRFKMNYGVVRKFVGEWDYFNVYRAYAKDKYLIESPLKNKKNAERILKLKIPLKKFKGNTNKFRKGPRDSATFHKLGCRMRGNDGNMWIIVENKNGIKRWQRLLSSF